MKGLRLTLLGAALIATPASAESECAKLAVKVKSTAERAAVDPVELLQLIDREVAAHPDCACEIVKTAILGTGCDDATVGYIVETAVRAAPDQMRLIAQCAIAAAPESLGRVQEVMNRLDPGAGETASAKSAKGKGLEVKPAAVPPNPLDLPVIVIPPVPPIINPPPSTRTGFVTPGNRR